MKIDERNLSIYESLNVEEVGMFESLKIYPILGSLQKDFHVFEGGEPLGQLLVLF